MEVTFAPGPSQAYPKLANYITGALSSGILSMPHRSEQYALMHQSLSVGLRELLSIPADYHLWFLGSATEAMERVIENTVRDRSHHFINGAFAQKFASIAAQLERNTTETKTEWHQAFDLTSEIVPDDAELIALTQNETSTGVYTAATDISALHARYPDKLIAVDVVSAVPHILLDYSSVDMAFFSVQKGFGLPAGLGVLVASPRALARSEQLAKQHISIGSFHSFPELAKNEVKFNTPETPNVLGIYLLDRVVHDMLAMGPSKMRAQLDQNAAVLYNAIDAHPVLTAAVTDPRFRSPTVIVASAPRQTELLAHLAKADMAVGKGYKDEKDSHIRIANFPAHLNHTDELIAKLSNWR